MTDEQFSIVYCQLSDGSPCANWQWRGKTPQAVAVLERRGTRISRIKAAKHGEWNDLQTFVRGKTLCYETYAIWTDMLRAERAYIKAIVAEVMES